MSNDEIIERLREDMLRVAQKPRVLDRPAPRLNATQDERVDDSLGFRVIGKRFTADAYIFANLTSPSVGTDQVPRNLPDALDVMALLGSKAASELVTPFKEKYKDYAIQFDKLKSEIPRMISRKENQTVYTCWLEMLRACFEDSGSKQFFYRAGGKWKWKQLLSASASWTELKHDTILYAKQSGAEMGAGGAWTPGKFAPPRPRGYVEPQPQVYAKLSATIDRLTSFMSKFSIKDDEYTRKLTTLKELCASAKAIADKEIAEQPMTADDFTKMESIAAAFKAQLLFPEEMGFNDDKENSERLKMALIADVATNFVDRTALYAAIGTPRKISVFVNDRSGGPRIAIGYVYSFYEFALPLENGRMTDDEWKKDIYDASKHDEIEKLHPSWYKELSQ